MALETKTTSFQRLYPGLAQFPRVTSGEGTGSLKSRVGQAAPFWEALSQAESGQMAASTARVRVRLPSVGQRCTLRYSLAQSVGRSAPHSWGRASLPTSLLSSTTKLGVTALKSLRPPEATGLSGFRAKL